MTTADEPETAELARSALAFLSELLAPLVRLVAAEDLTALCDRMGWDREALGLPDPSVFGTALGAIMGAVEEIEQAVQSDEEIELDTIGEIVAALVPVVVELASSIKQLSLVANAPAGTLEALAEDLLNFLVTYYLCTAKPALGASLEVLGVLALESATPIVLPDGTELRSAEPRRRLDFAALGNLVRDPLKYFRGRFLLTGPNAWRAVTDAADELGPILADALVRAGLGAAYGPELTSDGDPFTLDELAELAHLLVVQLPPLGLGPNASANATFVLGLSDDYVISGEGLGLFIAASGDVQTSFDTPIGTLSAKLAGSLEPLVITSHGVHADGGGTPTVDFEITLGYATRTQGGPALRFGGAEGTRFEIGSISATTSFLEDAKGTDFKASLDFKDVVVALQGGDGDGFLAQILPSDPIEARADLGFDLSLRSGFHVRASGSLEATIGLGLHLGPIEIVDATIALRATESSFKLEVYTTVGLEIGPVAAVVEGLGIAVALRPAASDRGAGALGAFDTSLGFRFPNGLGLSIDASSVKGGGYLFCDPDIGQYAGAAELAIAEQFELTAVGVLNTILPGGVSGFSLVLIATLTVESGIQLGYGFVLMGIGGLVGINRSMNADAIEACAADGRIDSILFPKDVVKNAPQVIRDIQTVFPPFEGQMVLGLMARIGWETLIRLDLGIMIELPSPIRIALLGRLSADLPTEDDPVLVLRMNVSGLLDFSQNLFAIRASVHDSRLLTFALTGDMALRLRWGDDPFFALSVGGFNPRFTPPPKFPALEPLGLVLFDEKDLQLRFESYFAITTNTLQLGASIYFAADKDIFMLGRFSASAELGFDALLQFQPFHFIVDVHGHIAIAHNDTPFVIAKLELTLEGPGRWHVSGYATFQFMGAEPRIDVNLEFGDEPPPALPVTVDVLELFDAALGVVGNWSAALPPSGDASVTLRSVDLGDAVVVHPLGELTVRQKVAPLGVRLEKYGEASVTGPNRFDLNFLVGDATAPATSVSVDDTFARGQYFKASNEDKLGQPEFERLSAGRTGIFSGGATVASGPRTVNTGYESSVIDDPLGPAEPASLAPPRGAAELVQSGSLGGKRAVLAADDAASTAKNSVAVRERRYRSLGFDARGTALSAGAASSFSVAKADVPSSNGRIAVATEEAA